MFSRRVESRVMKRYKPPLLCIRPLQIICHPLSEIRIVPIDVVVRIENQPVRIAPVEGEILHGRECRSSSVLERELVRGIWRSGRVWSSWLQRRPVERLNPIEKISENVGRTFVPFLIRIVVARRGDQRRGGQQRPPLLGTGLR